MPESTQHGMRNINPFVCFMANHANLNHVRTSANIVKQCATRFTGFYDILVPINPDIIVPRDPSILDIMTPINRNIL